MEETRNSAQWPVVDAAPPAGEHGTGDLRARRWFAAGCLALVILGAAVRVPYLASSNFPLNDGGMFAVMIDEVRAHHFLLPRTTSYNGENIPFVYPPLPFYMGALAAAATGQRATVILRWLPLLFNLLCIPALALAGRSILRSRSGGMWAGMTLALVPSAYIWEIMGGGLSRSPGFLFMILTLWQASELLLHHDRTWRRILATGIFAGLTVLSHPARPVPVALGITLMWLAESRDWQDLLALIKAAAVGLVLTSPWWILVLWRFGVAPWRAAASTTKAAVAHDLSFLVTFTAEAKPMLFDVLGIIGGVAALLSRWWYLPVWMVALAFVLPNGALATACIPLGLLAGLAMVRVILPGLNGFVAGGAWPGQVPPPSTERPRWAGPQAAPLLVTVLAIVLGLAGNGWVRTEGQVPLRAISVLDREAMRWVASSTPEDTSFLVLGPGFHWYDDAVGEWFPALAHRRSVTTAQGSEWLPGHTWQRLRDLRNRVIRRPWRFLPALCKEITAKAGDFQMVYISLQAARENPNVRAVLHLLKSSPRAALIYSNPGAEVFRLQYSARELARILHEDPSRPVREVSGRRTSVRTGPSPRTR